MNTILKARLLYGKSFTKCVQKYKVNYYSTQSAVKIEDRQGASNKQLLKEFEQISKITIRKRIKKPQKPPFLKNLFLGNFDTDILTYPQLEKEEYEQLNSNIEPVQKYFDGLTSEPNEMHLSSDFMENLRQLQLFGLQCPQLLHGRELNSTETCRFNDIMSNNTSSIKTLIYNDHLVIQALLKHGTDEQKQKYLSQLVNGNMLSAFCLMENNQKELNILQTTATLSSDKTTWVLNGEKSWIVNGRTADLLLVTASTEYLNKVGLKEKKLTNFLVEKSFKGVTSYACDPIGINGTDIANVRFENTLVPNGNIIGDINSGETLLESLLTEFRLNSGPACSTIIKKLLKHLILYCKDRNNGAACIADTDYVQSVIAEITLSLYSIESVTYLTAGILDQYENQDCLAESTIIKIFSAEETCKAILKCMKLIGTEAYMEDHWCSKLYRDALSYLVFHETTENLKLNLALLGIQHAGIHIQDNITKLRNPLYYPATIFKRMWTQRKQKEDQPDLTLHLADHVHPSATLTSEWLEYCVLRLQYGTETELARLGPEVVNDHMNLKRLAECAIDIYVMTACLGRASRSYCIGLQHADYEMILASTICVNAMERVKFKINKVCHGPYLNNNENYRKISKKIFKFGKYFPQHPLTRNF